MKTVSEELKNLRIIAEKALIQTDELEKVLNRVKATLAQSRARKV